MKIKNINIIGIFLCLSFCSCTRFLDEVPLSNEVRIETINDFQELLMGAAMQLTHVQYFPTVALYDDDMNQAPAYPTTTSSTVATIRGYHYTWQPNMMVEGNSLGDGYNLAYGRIKGCNAVLDGVDNAIGATQNQLFYARCSSSWV